jgi:hypothetical protein
MNPRIVAMEIPLINLNQRQTSHHLMVHPPTDRYRIPKIIQTADAIIPRSRTTRLREEAEAEAEAEAEPHSSSVILEAVLSPFQNRLERRLGEPILGPGAVKMSLHIQGKDIIDGVIGDTMFSEGHGIKER